MINIVIRKKFPYFFPFPYFFQYSGLISYFADRAKAMVQSMDPTNELLYLRVTSRYIELLGTILPIWGWQSTFLTANSREVLKVVNPMIGFFLLFIRPVLLVIQNLVRSVLNVLF